MKNSGIEWIGEIPSEWEVRALKSLFHIFSGTTPKSDNPDFWDEDIKWVTPADFSTDDVFISKGKRNISERGFKSYALEMIPDGNLIFSKRAPIGKVCINTDEMCINQGCLACVKKVDLDIKFFYYLLSVLTEYFELLGSGTTFKEISLSAFSNFKIPVPPLTSQLSLITFLDRKCSEIDSVISKTRETIEEYKKLKQSIITEVVTGKVKIENGKVCGKYDTYKDSGIEWIGEIPSEWEVKPIKALFSFGKGLPITKDNLTETGLSVISYGQIHSKNNIGTEIRNELIRYVDKIYYETNPQSLVHKGDFIFADTSEDLEGCGNFVYVNREEDLFSGYHTIILFSKEKNDNKYLAYLFQTDCWRRQIRCRCSGVKLFSISRRILGSTNLILPSILEQQQISDFLDKKYSEIDKLITKKEQLVVELEAYKKSLIYEVVTGKRSV